MKKIFIILLSLLVVFCVSAAAEEGITGGYDYPDYYDEPDIEIPTEAPQDMSSIRMMITAYKLDRDNLAPDETAKISITVKNMSTTKAIKNAYFTLASADGEIRPDGMGTEYIANIGAGRTYTWEIGITPIHTATEGDHELVFSAEYEDENYMSYSAGGTLRVELRQPVSLDYSGAQLPVKVTQEDTETVNITLMNTGKSQIYNCKVDYAIKGLESGGSTFVGDIPVSESKTATTNLRVGTDKLGEVKGNIVISYEDAFGVKYEKTIAVETIIEEKIEIVFEEEEEESPKKLWWLFMLIGVILGGSAGVGGTVFFFLNKQRKIDEERL